MLQFITVSNVTKHFVLNFTFQDFKESAVFQSPSSSLARLSESQNTSGEKLNKDAELIIVSY